MPDKRVVVCLEDDPFPMKQPGLGGVLLGDGKDRAHLRSGGAHLTAFQQRGAWWVWDHESV